MNSRWSLSGRTGDAYDDQWKGLEHPHGEADLVETFAPRRVLDAGCGTGRVAIELSRRGIDVAGADLDAGMLATARQKAPELEWHHTDLAEIDLLPQTFDVIVMAGNVMIFVAPGTEAQVIVRLARHLDAGGALIAGFSLRPGGYTLAEYDAHCARAGLVVDARFGTWDRMPYDGGDYAVSVHRRPTPEDR